MGEGRLPAAFVPTLCLVSMFFTRDKRYSAFHKNSFVSLDRGRITELWKVPHRLQIVFPLLHEELYLLLHWLPSVHVLPRMLSSKAADN